MADEVAEAYPACATRVGDDDPHRVDVVVNTMSMGLHPDDPDDPVPVQVDRLVPGTAVADKELLRLH